MSHFSLSSAVLVTNRSYICYLSNTLSAIHMANIAPAPAQVSLLMWIPSKSILTDTGWLLQPFMVITNNEKWPWMMIMIFCCCIGQIFKYLIFDPNVLWREKKKKRIAMWLMKKEVKVQGVFYGSCIIHTFNNFIFWIKINIKDAIGGVAPVPVVVSVLQPCKNINITILLFLHHHKVWL